MPAFTNMTDALTGTAGTPEQFTIADITDLVTADSVAATVNETNNQDSLVLLASATGTLTLNSTLFPNFVGLEGLALAGGNTNSYIFDLNYNFLDNNYENTNSFRFSIESSSGNHTFNITGLANSKRYLLQLGTGSTTVNGGDSSEGVSINTGIDKINLGNANDELYVNDPTHLSNSDTLDGSGGGADNFYLGGTGTYSSAQFSNVSNFEHLIFWPVTGSQSVTIPATFASSTVTAQIDDATAGRLIDVSAWTQSLNVTSNSATGTVTIAGGSVHDTLRGGSGADSLNGGNGADYLIPGDGADIIVTGLGNDTVAYGAASDANFDTISDLDVGDKILITGANFVNGFSVASGNAGAGFTGRAWLSLDGLTLYGDTNNNGSSDFQITLGTALTPGHFTATGTTITVVSPPPAFTAGTDTFTTFTAGPDTVTASSTAHIQAADTVTATVGDSAANADVLQLTTTGSYSLLGGTLNNVKGFESIQLVQTGGNVLAVDTAFLNNNYDSSGNLRLVAPASTGAAQTFNLSGSDIGKQFVIELPTAGLNNDVVTGSSGSELVSLNGSGNDSVSLNAGSDTVVISASSQLTTDDTITGGTGSDVLTLSNGGTYTAAQFTNVGGFETLRLTSNPSAFNVTLPDSFATSAGGTVTLELLSISVVPVIVNASAFTAANRLVMTGASPVRVGLTGGAGNDELYGRTAEGDSLNGGGGDDKLYPGSGAPNGDFVTMGGGADTVFGSAADLNKLTINDFGTGDVISLTSATLTSVMNVTGDGTALDGQSVQVDNGGGKLYIRTSAGVGAAESTITLTGGGYQPITFAVSGGKISYQTGGGLTFGVAGPETVNGTGGNDTFTTTAANLNSGDSLTGAGGTDKLQLSGAGTFTFTGVQGLASISHILGANVGQSVVLPTTENTKLVLGDGNDLVTVSGGAHTVWGGLGTDQVNVASSGTAVVVSTGALDAGTMTVALSGAGAATVFANGDLVTGATTGAVTVVADGTASTLVSLASTLGPVTAFLGVPFSQAHTGSGGDKLYGGLGRQRFDGGAGNDTLIGEGGTDVLIGGTGDDVLVGGADGDVLVAGGGADTLFGDGGRDIFVIGADGMDVIATFEPGIDRLNVSGLSITSFTQFEADTTATQLANGWRYVLTATPTVGVEIITPTKLTAADFQFGAVAVGGQGGDALTGGIRDDLLMGFAGNDTLLGWDGADTLVGGFGQDSLQGGPDADLYVLTSGDSRAVAGEVTIFDGFAEGTGDRIRLGFDAIHGLTLSGSTTVVMNTVASGTAADVTALLGLFSGVPASTSTTVQARSIIVTGGALSGQTFVLINDGTAGGQPTDTLIRLVGSATPTAVGFSFGDFL